MCLIFKKDKDMEPISRAWCEDVWGRNSDGWGIAFNKPSTNHMTIKTGMDFVDFWDRFSSLQRLDIDVFVHMRMATQGEVSPANNHPYCLSERHNIWLMHNGSLNYPGEGEMDDGDSDFIPEYPEDHYMRGAVAPYSAAYSGWGSGPSDTYLLVERLLKPMLKNMVNASDFIRSKGFEWMMEQTNGAYNKFTLHDNWGHVVLNQEDWHETETGILVSNTYAFSLDKKPYKTTRFNAQKEAS